VYERLAETALEVHVYGVPGRDPDLPVAVHGGDGEERRRAWFVVHGGDDNDGWKAALVATHVGGNTYRGFWTFDPAVVDEVRAYVVDGFPENS